MQIFVHYFLHFGFPLILAVLFWKESWKKVYLIFLATMLVDLDHLLADPIFSSNRCSINFHFLHTYYAIIIYTLLLFLKKTWRWVGLGLLLHMLTDLIDCLFIYSKCSNCLIDETLNGLLLSIFG